MFIGSGTVRDDPLILIEVQTRRIGLDVAKPNRNCPGHMTLLILSGIAHVHDDCRAAFERSFGFLDCHARYIRLCERKITGCFSTYGSDDLCRC